MSCDAASSQHGHHQIRRDWGGGRSSMTVTTTPGTGTAVGGTEDRDHLVLGVHQGRDSGDLRVEPRHPDDPRVTAPDESNPTAAGNGAWVFWVSTVVVVEKPCGRHGHFVSSRKPRGCLPQTTRPWAKGRSRPSAIAGCAAP